MAAMLRIDELRSATPLTGDSNHLVLPLFKETLRPPTNSLAGFSRTNRALARHAIESKEFTGEYGKNFPLWSPSQFITLVGSGNPSALTTGSSRLLGGKIRASIGDEPSDVIIIRFTKNWKLDFMVSFLEGFLLRDYRYLAYKTDAKKQDFSVHVQVQPRYLDALRESSERMMKVVDGVHFSRDLANAPPNELYPESFVKRVIERLNGRNNISIEVLEEDELLSAGMGGLIGVGQGSRRPPRLMIIKLNTPSKGKGKQAPLAIVGKGITFDTGGISIKPSSSMDEMKFDMHGAATVAGVMDALSAMESDKHVIGFAALAENMPDGNAQRPGDVISTYSGKTVEVLNTDAEGRLVLADALWKACEYEPKWIIDLATLTGAIVTALGHEATGLWSNNDDLASDIKRAGDSVGELIWPMPYLEAFIKQVTSSKIADLKNLGERWGGSNSAAAFLGEFIKKRDVDGCEQPVPWAHLDIAGTAWGVKSDLVDHGATGVHVRTLVDLINNQ